MKKRIDIYGTLETPLERGCSAFIKEVGKKPFRTSAVQHYITSPSGLIYIQTKNTHYYLHPPANAGTALGVRA